MKTVLAQNLKALMLKEEHSQGRVHAIAKSKGYTLSQSTVGRILNQENWATLENIEAIADIYGLLPWQLLVENLEVGNPPVIRDKTGVEKELYERLEMLMGQIKAESHQ